MLTQLLDIFGFLSVLLRGGTLALQSLVLGGALFRCWVLRAAVGSLPDERVAESCRWLMFWSAMALAIAESCYVFSSAAILTGTAGLTLSEVLGANFFIAGVAAAGAAATIAASTARPDWNQSLTLLAASGVILTALVMTSHAAGRMEHRTILIGLTALHQAAEVVYGTLGAQAHLWAFVDNFRLFALLSLACVPLVFLFKPPKRPPKPAAGAH